MKAYRFHPEALAELEAAAEWYEASRIGLGNDLLDAVTIAVSLVCEHPGAGAITEIVGDREVRRKLLGRFPLGLVYYSADDEIRIVAVAHTKRAPGYWRSRVGGA